MGERLTFFPNRARTLRLHISPMSAATNIYKPLTTLPEICFARREVLAILKTEIND